MRLLFAIALLAVGYAIVYYRLLVKFYYEKQHGLSESTFGALFSFPPYKDLPEKGRKYARRYFVAVGLLVACVIALARLSDFSYLAHWAP
jgi:hypothetical protein